MARKFASGSSQSGSILLDLSPYATVSFSFWMWWDAFANDDKLAFEYTTNYNNGGGLLIDPNSGAGASAFDVNATAGSLQFQAAQFTRPSAAAWHHYVISYDTTTVVNAIKVYVDGVVPAGFSFTGDGGAHTARLGNSTLYVMSRAAGSLFGSGRLADLAIWGNAFLTPGEAATLFKNLLPPQVRPDRLILFKRLIGEVPERSPGPGPNVTLGGSPPLVDHPLGLPVYQPQVLLGSRL